MSEPVVMPGPHGVANGIGVAGRSIVIAIHYAESRIYVLEGSPRPKRVIPSDPRGYHRQLHSKAGTLSGFYDSDDVEVWRSLAQQVRGADAIFILGHGSGKANASHQFIAHVEQHDRDTARVILGDVRVDVDDLTDAHVLRLGQQFFDTAPPRS